MYTFQTSLRLVLSFKFGKETKIASFNPSSIYNHTYAFHTEDEELAEAIRQHPDFGKYIKEIVEVKEETPKEEETVQEVKGEYVDVKKTQDAIKVLVSDYGVDGSTLTTKATVLAKAKELGVVFPHLK